MNKLTSAVLTAIIFSVMAPITALAAESASGALDDRMASQARFLNEFNEQRRVNTFFPNEQSLLFGFQKDMVNVGKGNLTFAHRDLVVVGRVPIVFARVYDSSWQGSTDFGPGWLLTYNETIAELPNGELLYMGDTANSIRLAPSQGDDYSIFPPHPSDINSVSTEQGFGGGTASIHINFNSGWRKTFEKIGDLYRLVSLSDRNGNEISINFTGDSISTIEGPNGRYVDISRDFNGRIVSISDDLGRTVSYQYDEQGRLVTFNDRGGNSWDYRYNDNNQLELVTDPNGLTALDVAYDNRGRVSRSRIRDSSNRYTYQRNSTVVREDNQNSFRSTLTQNEMGITTSVTNRAGETSSIELNQNNQVVALSLDGVEIASMSYDSSGRLEALERIDDDVEGAIEFVQYQYSYNTSGNLASVHTGAEEVLSLLYDDRGNVLSVTEEGNTREYAYNSFGDVVIEEKSGIRTGMSYNEDGLLTEYSSDGQSAFLSYTDEGDLASVEFPNGSTHFYQRDLLGFRSNTQRNDSSWQSYDYNSLGQLVAAQGAVPGKESSSQQYHFDEFNRLVEIEFPSDSAQISYDRRGNPVTIAWEEMQVEYAYDGRGRLTAVVDSIHGRSSYSYKGNEQDLRIQLDEPTAVTHVPANRISHNRSTLLESLYTRASGTPFGVVTWNQSTGIIGLSSDLGVLAPDTAYLRAKQRRRLGDLLTTHNAEQRKFDTASSSFYLPPEYASVNCKPSCYIGPLNMNQPSSIVAGSPAIFQSWPDYEGWECDVVTYTWYVNGIPVYSSSLSGFFTYIFPSQGPYTVKVVAECGGCDSLFSTREMTIQVDVLECGADETSYSPPPGSLLSSIPVNQPNILFNSEGQRVWGLTSMQDDYSGLSCPKRCINNEYKYRLEGGATPSNASISISQGLRSINFCSAGPRESSKVARTVSHENHHASTLLFEINQTGSLTGGVWDTLSECETHKASVISVESGVYDFVFQQEDDHVHFSGVRRFVEVCPTPSAPTYEAECITEANCSDPTY